MFKSVSLLHQVPPLGSSLLLDYSSLVPIRHTLLSGILWLVEIPRLDD